MKAVVFDIKGDVAHFRRPDTTATQLTYPFITPIAAKGLVGAILGITDFVTEDKVGIQILNPIRTSAQQMSLLGKGAGSSFNRPTAMELLVNPGYRIYYAGDEYVDELANRLEKKNSEYHTYLGVAFALTFPQLIRYYDDVESIMKNEVIETRSIVPTCMIDELIIEEGYYYNRAGGFMKDYLGERRFEKSISYIYEEDGQSIRFRLKPNNGEDCVAAYIGGMPICLV